MVMIVWRSRGSSASCLASSLRMRSKHSHSRKIVAVTGGEDDSSGGNNAVDAELATAISRSSTCRVTNGHKTPQHNRLCDVEATHHASCGWDVRVVDSTHCKNITDSCWPSVSASQAMQANADIESSENCRHCAASNRQHEADTSPAKAHSATECTKTDTTEASSGSSEGDSNRTAGQGIHIR